MFSTLLVSVPYTVMGANTIDGIGEIVRDLGAAKALIVTDIGVSKAGLLDKVKSSLEKNECKYDVFDGCEPNAPISVIEQCSQKVTDEGHDLLIGIGGGSVMDTTKVVSVIAASGIKALDLLPPGKPIKKVIPKILVPTTAGTGSEWSNLANVTDDSEGLKKLMQFKQFWADAVILDPEMTLNLPQNITAETGMDALSHGIESYVCAASSIVSDMFAEAAIKLVADNLRLAYAKGNKHIEARYKMAIAASLAMKAGEISSTGLGHFIDSFIVSKVHISHGAALTILLPHVMEFNLIAAPGKFARIAELLGEQTSGLSTMDAAQKSVEAVRRLAQDIGLTQRLGDVGITEADIPQLVSDLFRLKARPIELFNPRNATPDDVAGILKAAL
ncbi:iron-containing alcohol dehydrogenase [Chloroflexota bacterium]